MSNKNFGIILETDGEEHIVEDNEITIKISQRKYGKLVPSLTIRCREDEGIITTEAFCGNNLIWKMKTER